MDRKAWRGSTKTNSFAHFGRLHQFCHKELHSGFKGVGNFYSLQHFNTPKSAQKAQLAIILDWSITELLRRKGNTKKNSFLKSKSKNPWPQSSHSANCFLASSCICVLSTSPFSYTMILKIDTWVIKTFWSLLMISSNLKPGPVCSVACKLSREAPTLISECSKHALMNPMLQLSTTNNAQWHRL